MHTTGPNRFVSTLTVKIICEKNLGYQPKMSLLLPRRFPLIAALLLVLVAVSSRPSAAFCQDEEQIERPLTQDLLPETTVVFFQIDNIREMVTKIQESSIGKLAQNESIAPLIEGMWGEAKAAYGDYEEQIGVSLEDLQAFPAGELTFAIIAPRRKDPEFLLIVETDPESEAVDRVLDRGRNLIREQAGEEIETEISDDGFEIESFKAEDRVVKFFRKDGLMVGCTSEDELNDLIDRWMGREVEKVRPLSTNRKFVTIMNRCRGNNDIRPEARFFVDPITMVKSFNRGNAPVQAGLAFLPVLGLDGLLAVGGSALYSEEEFASVAHAHILLAEPRKGIFEMLAFKPTDYQPEPFLPQNVVNYLTTSWDVDQMLAELTTMIETFQGEGVVDEFFENNLNQELGFDVREEILGGLTGRVTYVQWMEPPARINSQVNVIALEVKDPAAFEATMEKVIERINRDQAEDEPDRVDETEYKGIRIFGPSEERLEEQWNQRRERRLEQGRGDIAPVEINVPKPSFALIGNHLVISPQSREFVRRAIEVDQGDSESLAASEEYQIISQRMTRLLGSDMPSAMMYARPVESIRWMFEMAKSPDSREFLAKQAEENKYVGGIKNVLDENPLPEFEELEKYFQPQGGFMTSDDTGLHFLIFELRAPDDDE